MPKCATVNIPPNISEFWSRFKTASDSVSDDQFYEAFHFGDTAALADELLNLVLSNKKRATAGSLWVFEFRGVSPPRIGDLSVVTDSTGDPMCVIQTTAVAVVPFLEVSAEFARAEGEGDATLASWREDHTVFFNRECDRIGRQFNHSMPVVCERFDLVYSEAASSTA